MLNEVEQLLNEVKQARFTKRSDPQLLQAEASARLAVEISKLNASLERVTAASDAIRGGYAIRTVAADR